MSFEAIYCDICKLVQEQAGVCICQGNPIDEYMN